GKASDTGGKAGDGHPVSGATHAERLASLSKLAQSGAADPTGYLKADWPEGVDPSVGTAILAAVGRHQSDKTVGPDLVKLYADAGEPNGLTKHEFMQAVGSLAKSGKLTLSKWAKTLSDLPDPQLVALSPGGGGGVSSPLAYAHAPTHDAAKEYAAAAPAPQSEPAAPPAAPAPAPAAESPLDRDAAHYAKLVADGEDRQAKAFVAFVARSRNLPKDQVAAHFAKRSRAEAREDRAGLVKKKVQGKDGKTHTVYVRPDQDRAADAGGKSGDDSQPHPADSDPPSAESLDLSGAHDDPGVVARVREKVGRILTALARRAYDAALLSPQIIDAAGLLVDTPEDMQKIGYNPATAGTQQNATGNVLQDAGIPLTPYQFVNLCTTVLPGVIGWVKGKFGGGSAAESDDIDALAELLHGLLAELAGEFGFAAPPDAATIAANLRAL
ncbi:MAG TPA: hypothetical protein VM529_20670, partial [Gemmata sp.]|nr:hypothetical protein [Gemmata sp.]